MIRRVGGSTAYSGVCIVLTLSHCVVNFNYYVGIDCTIQTCVLPLSTTA